MRKRSRLGMLLALLVLSACAGTAEASKVSVQGEAVRKAPAKEPVWQEPNATTAGTSREPTGPAAPAFSPGSKEPVRWDALPEKERKLRLEDLLLGKLAEV
ncbi:MAG: hypothetical protein HY816_19190 [Candidatus Wallbacteria bacterium]|nr:hypothetical protein [Candidatus Wallbacteria bacterium]